MYKCKHFEIYELVPKELSRFPESKLWLLFDDRALKTLDMLRDEFGTITVNDWAFDGKLTQCGFRTNDNLGAKFSQHRYGRAFDCHFQNASVEEVRKLCKEKVFKCFEHITAIEDGVSWFHFDVRNHDGDLLIFNP